MPNKTNTVDKLQGLILPEDALMSGFWIVGLGVLIALFLLGAWRIYAQYKTPKKQAIKKLKALYSKVKSGKEKPQQTTALALLHVLQQGLKIPRLALFKTADKAEWKNFKKMLESACYSKEPPTKITLETLLKQALQWLKQP